MSMLVAAVVAVVLVVAGILIIPNAIRGSPAAPAPTRTPTAEPSTVPTTRPPAPNPTAETRDAEAAQRARQARTLQTLMSNVVTSMVDPRDGTFADATYSGGMWRGTAAVNRCWRCTFGPAVAAAALAATTRSARYTAIAQRTFDAALAYQQPSGAFVAPGTTQSPDIDTMYFATELGLAFSSLAPSLGAKRRTAWANALAGAANYLAANKNLSWYTNGNIVIGNVAAMAAAWKATGRTIYRTYMDTALAFAIDPPQQTWPGRGLIYTRAPTRMDGSDGAAYFSEFGPAGPGFDPDYTQLQADNATTLYLLTGDPRALRLMNLLVNQLLTRTNTATWHLDTSYGSRHRAAGQWRYLSTGALTVLAWRGGRTDLARDVASQLSTVVTNFTDESQFTQPGTWFAFGQQPASAYLAAAG